MVKLQQEPTIIRKFKGFQPDHVFLFVPKKGFIKVDYLQQSLAVGGFDDKNAFDAENMAAVTFLESQSDYGKQKKHYFMYHTLKPKWALCGRHDSHLLTVQTKGIKREDCIFQLLKSGECSWKTEIEGIEKFGMQSNVFLTTWALNKFKTFLKISLLNLIMWL